MARSAANTIFTIAGIASVLLLPAAGFGETTTLVYETFDWSSGQINPSYVRLPISFSQSATTINDVRVRYVGVSHTGTGWCCQGGECAIFDCDVQLLVSFAGNDSVQAIVDLPGEDEEHSGEFDFLVYSWSPYWPYYTTSPLSEDSWSFLEAGTGTLYITDSSATDCNTKCSAYIDLSEVVVEIDYSAQVPAGRVTWSGLKAAYR